MAKLGFCGLGQMGGPMAARLVGAGHDVTVWNRTPARADALVEQGARRAGTPAEAAAGAEAVFTMLATPEALEAVLFGPDGLAAGLGAGTTLVEQSTVGPDAVAAACDRLPAGVAMLDAPVLGSVQAATDGTLEVFVGGDAGVFERWRPVLEVLGHPVHLGPLGAGAAMKLVVNSTLGALMTGLAEALALADALGVDQSAALDVLAGSPIGVTARGKRERIESGRYPPNFKLALATKDMRLVTEAARRAGLEARLAAAARSWLEEADAAGLGPLDYSAVIAHVRRRPALP
ncbi:MAG TPA: NAD(P)-dependent oxidoreductase [Acidimicrobiales bacterium]|nr:NAD(P)-dependent oxidoreductase [Acidimicrobiales bacterium]